MSETRTEYSLVVEQPGGSVRLGPEDRETLEAHAHSLLKPHILPDSEIEGARLERRTVTYTEWTEVEGDA